jgi:hypothetical protein
MTIYLIGDYLFYSLEAAEKFFASKEMNGREGESK